MFTRQAELDVFISVLNKSQLYEFGYTNVYIYKIPRRSRICWGQQLGEILPLGLVVRGITGFTTHRTS